MATIKLMLNKARQLNDGTFPLVVQILHLRKKRLIYLRIYLHLDEFDQKTKQIVINTDDAQRQKELKSLRRKINDHLERFNFIKEKLEQNKAPYTCDTIIEIYRLGNGSASLVQFWEAKINQLRNMNKFGIANAQQYTLNSVIRFVKSEYIGIGKVTAAFVKNYALYLQERGLSQNTVCYYMRNFKTIMNHAINERVAKQKITVLFNGIKTAPRKTLKRAIMRDQLRALSQMEFQNEPLLQFARDLFMFSFYTRGMAFVDIAFLRRENIAGNVLSYSRRKTGQILKMSINNPMKILIEKYKSVSQYLFPIVFSNDTEVAYQEYRNSLRKINKALKIIGARLCLDTSLTTYVARHSWATQAKQKGYPLSVISEGLGHRSENITQIYLKDFDHTILDNANDVITNL